MSTVDLDAVEAGDLRAASRRGKLGDHPLEVRLGGSANALAWVRAPRFDAAHRAVSARAPVEDLDDGHGAAGVQRRGEGSEQGNLSSSKMPSSPGHPCRPGDVRGAGHLMPDPPAARDTSHRVVVP